MVGKVVERGLCSNAVLKGGLGMRPVYRNAVLKGGQGMRLVGM